MFRLVAKKEGVGARDKLSFQTIIQTLSATWLNTDFLTPLRTYEKAY